MSWHRQRDRDLDRDRDRDRDRDEIHSCYLIFNAIHEGVYGASMLGIRELRTKTTYLEYHWPRHASRRYGGTV